MYRFVLAALLAAAPAMAASERWIEYRIGPFHVFSDAGDKLARDRLNEMEQLRHVLGDVLGKNGLGVGGPGETQLDTEWPIVLILFPNAKDYGPHAPKRPFTEGGSAMLAAWTADTPLAHDFLRALTRMLLEQNSARMPDDVESGLCDLLSNIKANGTRVTIGAPPAQGELPPERLRAWAKMQLLSTSPDYNGKLRVYLNNLQSGGDEALAARSAFGLTMAKLNEIVDAYLKAGKFEAAPVSGEAIDPRRDFVEKPVDKTVVDELLTELAADGKDFPPESARGLIEGRTREELEAAKQANPKWGEPYFRLSALEETDELKIQDLKTAVKLEPRNTEYWEELAQVQTMAHHYSDAEKAWTSAVKAASDSAEREQIRKTRLEVEQKRADFEASEIKRIAAENAADIERLKQSAAAEVHAAEDAATKQAGGLKPGEKPIAWWTEPEGEKLSGKLARVDCLSGGALRLTINIDGGGTIRLLIPDPKRLQVPGGDDAKFVCGVQRTARKIRVIYNVKTDAKLNTVGEVAMVDFP